MPSAFARSWDVAVLGIEIRGGAVELESTEVHFCAHGSGASSVTIAVCRLGLQGLVVASLVACQNSASRETKGEEPAEAVEEVRGDLQDAEPPGSFAPQALPICDEPDASPLGFICDLGRDAAQVDLGCEAPRVIKACRALIPSHSGHVYSPPPDENVFTIGYVPWDSGLLTEQAYVGPVSAISKAWRIEDEGEVARRWQESRGQLASWGCESVNLIEGKREHLLCGPDWEARLTHALDRFNVEVGTTGYFDCRYAGMHGEASRPSRTEW